MLGETSWIDGAELQMDTQAAVCWSDISLHGPSRAMARFGRQIQTFLTSMSIFCRLDIFHAVVSQLDIESLM